MSEMSKDIKVEEKLEEALDLSVSGRYAKEERKEDLNVSGRYAEEERTLDLYVSGRYAEEERKEDLNVSGRYAEEERKEDLNVSGRYAEEERKEDLNVSGRYAEEERKEVPFISSLSQYRFLPEMFPFGGFSYQYGSNLPSSSTNIRNENHKVFVNVNTLSPPSDDSSNLNALPSPPSGRSSTSLDDTENPNKRFKRDTVKDEAYLERRKKNNLAAKRSRDAKRQREEEIKGRVFQLEAENKKLREDLANCRCRMMNPFAICQM